MRQSNAYGKKMAIKLLSGAKHHLCLIGDTTITLSWALCAQPQCIILMC